MFRIGLENNAEGRSQAWVLGHPGCYAYGTDGKRALDAVTNALTRYRSWIDAHTSESWLEAGDDTFKLDETWECYTIDSDYELAQDGYEVNAWFRHDWLPLSEDDVNRGLLLLTWGREELLKTVGNTSTDILERTYPGERWSIAGILKHIGGAEWWYQDRLGVAFPREQVSEQPFERLEAVRSHLIAILPGFIGVKQVVGISGEFWSPRKLLRRAVWHELDHIDHIRKLL